MSRVRFLLIAGSISLVLAAAGFGWRGVRFGWDPADRAAHLQQDLTHRMAGRVSTVTDAASRAASLGALVSDAATSRDHVGDLFAQLSALDDATGGAASITIWVPSGTSPDYRALAWTDGPSEEFGPGRLDQAPILFATAASGGLRLINILPIEYNQHRIGVAVAEEMLSSVTADGSFERSPTVDSLIGPLPVEALETRGGIARSGALTIAAPDGTPLFDVRVPEPQFDAAERMFAWRIAAVALAPLALAGLVFAGEALRRRRQANTASGWVLWTAVVAVAVGLAAAGASQILRGAGAPQIWLDALTAVTALAVAFQVGGDALRRASPLHAMRAPVQFVVEQLLAGVFLTAGVGATEWLWHHRINPSSIEQWHLPALPSSFPVAIALLSVLVMQIAIAWMAAAGMGVLAARWRISDRASRLLIAAGIWFVPLIVWLLAEPPDPSRPLGTALVFAAALATFGLFATSLRRRYRHASEVQRMVLLFTALFAPVLAAYPLAAASADRATIRLIETEYAPDTQQAQQPDRLMASLTSAWAAIDAVTELPDQLREAGTSGNSTQLAFQVWNRTLLSQNRIPSQIELYGPLRKLVSRFALNVPEFGLLSQTGDQTWQGSSCEWDAFGGVARFGAGERRMFHSERALCGAHGEFLGAVVVRIIPDYRTLPFVASTNPYYDALGGGDRPRADTRVSDLQVVVYGWSLQPTFVSGRTIWPLDQGIYDRLYRSPDAREPFWVDRAAEGRRYHVHFSSDRGGIYAVGYPAPTALQHATRLAESAALLLVLFLIYLGATAIRWPLLSTRLPPLGRLLAEIRASFHRKLLLYFVVAAIAPIIVFAVAFGFYMTNRLRADIKSEAGSVVLMARRVLDELSAAQTPAGESRPMPVDDVMVWIRQVVDQDVNLFEGAELRATSQRDLFNSGLLPTRTPFRVYQEVALGGRPVFVTEDQIGTFHYLVAAAPVTGFGRDVVLTVPLASRQRDIERQIDELTQGVLTGAVVLVLFAAALGASVAGRVSDPIARLTRATRLVAAGRFDERLAARTADELGRLVEDFNTMTQVLLAQRTELARTNQIKAWAEMSRQVAHEIKNPLTPIQLAAEHLQRVHEDAHRPLGPVVEQCLTTILGQVRLLRQIASEFSTFAGTPTPRFEAVAIGSLVESVVEPYRASQPAGIQITVRVDEGLPLVQTDRTLLARAFTNLVENALQAMPNGGRLTIAVSQLGDSIRVELVDTGVGMDAEGVRRAFEPYFSTKTGGSGLGLANARRNIETCGGRIELSSRQGAGTTVTVTVPIDRRGVNASG